MDAKQALVNFVPIIDKKLEEYWKTELAKNFGYNQHQRDLVEKMLKHASEHSLRSSKRLRGAFTYYGYMLGKSVDERIWKASMGVELVHTALLMHDDFMDQDSVRRGRPTTHKYFEDGDKHYGETMAVNMGDAVLEIGQELLIDADFEDRLVRRATKKMLRGITQTVWGQAYDSTLEKIMEVVGEEDVIVLHKAKTAIYTYENPLYIGAILAGLEGEVFEVLTEYSMDGGVAFQLQDDILGVYGDPEKTGKSANSDLLQGKVTLLILDTLKKGTPEQVADLKKVWGKRVATTDDIEKAKKAIADCGALDYSRSISRDYASKAAKTAERLRGLNLNSEAIDFIQGIAEYMVTREV
ncbi:polyprenyl synthetase family protein [Candidatus Shapirobacteria bacterium]|nr:polyprenyl synthetase family protein [Candidatus Shapirobacteria bacterium]